MCTTEMGEGCAHIEAAILAHASPRMAVVDGGAQRIRYKEYYQIEHALDPWVLRMWWLAHLKFEVCGIKDAATEFSFDVYQRAVDATASDLFAERSA